MKETIMENEEILYENDIGIIWFEDGKYYCESAKTGMIRTCDNYAGALEILLDKPHPSD